MLLQTVVASGTHIVAKVVVKDVEPITLTMLRSLIAAIGLLLISLVRKTNFKFAKEDYKMIMLLSFLAIPLNQFLFLAAIKFTTPTNAALLYGTTPAIVLLISYLLGKEELNWKKAAGVAIAFLGIFMIVFEKGIDLSSEHTIGNLILVIAVISWAYYTIYGRLFVLKYGAFTTSSVTMIIGTIMFIPIGTVGVLSFDFSTLTISHWEGILYLSLGTSIFAYLLWYYALGKISATKVAVFANLQPVVTTILAILILDQVITPLFIVGGSIAICGVILAQFG